MRWNHLVRGTIAATTLSLLLGLAAAPVAAGSSGRSVRFVDDDGLADGVHGCAGIGMAFTEIQLAIDDSDANDVVNVCPGTYREHVSIAGRPGLVLQAVKPWKATIKPPAPGTSVAGPPDFFPAAIDISSTGAVVRWMNIVIPASGDCDYHMNGIIVDGAHDVVVRSNHLSGGAGDPTTCGLADPIIYTNESSGIVGFNLMTRFNDTGILVGSGSDVRVYQNSIRFFVHSETCTASPAVVCASGTSPAGGIAIRGIAVNDGSKARIRRNVLKEVPRTGSTNIPTVGIVIDSSRASVSRNRIRGLSTGIDVNLVDGGTIRLNRVSGGSGNGIFLSLATGVLVADNLVFDRGGSGMFVNSDSDGNTIRDNNFSGNAGVDCVDNSGPSNTWTNNLGDESAPGGLCIAAP